MGIPKSIDTDRLLRAVTEGPGYWSYVLDEPEHVFTDEKTPPTHTPAGHWEWIPSTKDMFKSKASLLKDLTKDRE